MPANGIAGKPAPTEDLVRERLAEALPRFRQPALDCLLRCLQA